MIRYNTKNWAILVVQLRGSVLFSVLPQMLIAGIAGLIAAWTHSEYDYEATSTVHLYIGVALGFLLVFRANLAYDRYWEGRRLLGELTSNARDLTVQLTTFVEGDDDEARQERFEIRRLLNVLFNAIIADIRNDDALKSYQEMLAPSEREILEVQKFNRPGIIAQWLSRQLTSSARHARITEQRLHIMHECVSKFLSLWSSLEAIAHTPLPYPYAQLLKSFLMIYITTAPFTYVQSFEWLTPVVAALMAYGLVGIDEVGVEIENPFGSDANDLPLESIREVVKTDTQQILSLRNAPEQLAEARENETVSKYNRARVGLLR